MRFLRTGRDRPIAESEDRRHRSAPPDPALDTYTFAGRTLDFANMEVRARGETHRLTQMECELLRYLVTHPGQVIPRTRLLEDVWGLQEGTDTRAIDNFIVRLRKYLGSAKLAAVPAHRPRRRLQVRARGERELSLTSNRRQKADARRQELALASQRALQDDAPYDLVGSD